MLGERGREREDAWKCSNWSTCREFIAKYQCEVLDGHQERGDMMTGLEEWDTGPRYRSKYSSESVNPRGVHYTQSVNCTNCLLAFKLEVQP